MRLASRILLPALALSMVALAPAQKPTLKVGSVAPSFKPAVWVKGKPFELKKGQVYVVEFWATWCGPCATSIPHITKLAKQYKGKASFIGVSISEEAPTKWGPETIKKVKAYVKGMGSKMDYNVVMDGKDGKIARTWLMPTGIQYIPSAIVVNKQGKISWMGNPMSGLDEAVKAATKGK